MGFLGNCIEQYRIKDLDMLDKGLPRQGLTFERNKKLYSIDWLALLYLEEKLLLR
jgi:hypothetical protein